MRPESADKPLQRRVATPGAAQQLVQAAGEGAEVAPWARVAQRADQGAHQALALRREDLLHRLPVCLHRWDQALISSRPPLQHPRNWWFWPVVPY